MSLNVSPNYSLFKKTKQVFLQSHLSFLEGTLFFWQRWHDSPFQRISVVEAEHESVKGPPLKLKLMNLNIQQNSPCQMMIRVYKHLRDARYLGSIKPFSVSGIESLGIIYIAWTWGHHFSPSRPIPWESRSCRRKAGGSEEYSRWVHKGCGWFNQTNHPENPR